MGKDPAVGAPRTARLKREHDPPAACECPSERCSLSGKRLPRPARPCGRGTDDSPQSYLGDGSIMQRIVDIDFDCVAIDDACDLGPYAVVGRKIIGPAYEQPAAPIGDHEHRGDEKDPDHPPPPPGNQTHDRLSGFAAGSSLSDRASAASRHASCRHR